MAKTPVPSDDTPLAPADAESSAFVRGLIERGEAVVQPEAGIALPPKATHVIVGQTERGEPVVKRVRFSAF